MAASLPLKAPKRLEDVAAAEALFAPLAEEVLEVLAVVYLGADQRVLGMRHVRSEHPGGLDLPIREIARDAIAYDAVGVVMAHNHPSGDPTPSSADRDATRLLARGLEALDVRLLDHLVVSRGGITSFRARGWL